MTMFLVSLLRHLVIDFLVIVVSQSRGLVIGHRFDPKNQLPATKPAAMTPNHSLIYNPFLSLITNTCAEISPGFNPERSTMQSLPACLNGNELLFPKTLITVPVAGLKLRNDIDER